MGLMRSPSTAVHLVTLLEEMPVQETLDGIVDLTAAGLPVGAVIVNAVRDELLPPKALSAADAGRLDAAQVRAGLAAAGLVRNGGSDRAQAMAVGLIAQGAEHSRRLALQRRERASLDELDQPGYELPYLAGGVDLGGLYELAGEMRRQGLA
jgi:hypothetical protein